MTASDLTWSVTDPDNPRLRAVIKTDFWQMSTETGQIMPSLSVLENSLLILFCFASYPVQWYNGTDTKVKIL